VIRILFVAANPVDTDPLQLGEEFREIQSKLRSSDSRAHFVLGSAWAARPDDLLQQMNEFRPHILHFSGHGSNAGEIMLQDSSGKTQTVSPAVLKALFENFREWLRIVVLNACYSNVQAEALLESADIVIGMKSAIGDKAAISFTSAFYRALGFDRSVQDSFNQGLISLQLEKIPEEHIPELLHRPGIQPDRLTLTDPGNLAVARQRIDDPSTPESVRKLLRQGTEMILLDEEEDDRPTDKANRLLIELGMRQSSAVFIVEVNRRLPIGRVALRLAQRLLPDMDVDGYEWTLVKGDKSLPGEHTLMMAGVRGGDQVKLVGNHRQPMWAPCIVLESDWEEG
jgi:CHAT domain